MRNNDYPVFERAITNTRLQLGDKTEYTMPRMLNEAKYDFSLVVDESTVPSFMVFKRIGNTTENSSYFFEMAPTVLLQNQNNIIKTHSVCVDVVLTTNLNSYEPRNCFNVEVYDWPSNVGFGIELAKTNFHEIYCRFNESVSFPEDF